MLFFWDVYILFLWDVYITLRSKLSCNLGLILKLFSISMDLSVFLDDWLVFGRTLMNALFVWLWFYLGILLDYSMFNDLSMTFLDCDALFRFRFRRPSRSFNNFWYLLPSYLLLSYMFSTVYATLWSLNEFFSIFFDWNLRKLCISLCLCFFSPLFS